jgi:hypothetical protein
MDIDIYIFYPKDVPLIKMESEKKIGALSNCLQIKG